jgi:hypothetical protein
MSMITAIRLKPGTHFRKNKNKRELSDLLFYLKSSDKDDDSTADEEDLLHTRIKRRSGRSPNSSQVQLNVDVSV